MEDGGAGGATEAEVAVAGYVLDAATTSSLMIITIL